MECVGSERGGYGGKSSLWKGNNRGRRLVFCHRVDLLAALPSATMTASNSLLFAAGGAGAGAKYIAPRYLNALSWGEAAAMLAIFTGIILVLGYILSIISKRRRRYPPDTFD
jgi:hypothetical protein